MDFRIFIMQNHTLEWRFYRVEIASYPTISVIVLVNMMFKDITQLHVWV